jgi:hypothetical protein
MPTIYDLSIIQQEIIDMFFWEDSEEEITQLQAQIDRIAGTVERKIKFLTGILIETESIAEARKEAVINAQRRLKTAENAHERIKQFILDAMVQFDIKRVDGELCGVTHYLSAGSVVFEDRFNYQSLPAECLKLIPEHIEPIKSEVKKLLLEGEKIPGVMVVKKEVLKML